MAISDTMSEAINRHVNAEFYSSYLYLSMATFLDAIELPGFAHWMRIQSQEEYAHAIRFIDYIQNRDGRIALLPIDQPPIEFDSVGHVMELTLGHEQHVSALINELYGMAAAEGDYATQVMLQWFVNEQVEEEKTVRDVIASLRMVSDRSDSLLLLDREMGSRTASAPA
jgi:ferritin